MDAPYTRRYEDMNTRIHMDIGLQLNDRTVDHIVLVHAIDATEKVGDNYI